MPIIRSHVKTITAGEVEGSRKFSTVGSEKDGCNRERPDLLRRFAAMPHSADLLFMGRTVRVETNSNTALELVRSFFFQYQVATPTKPEFLWRIICESDEEADVTTAPLSAFSEPGLQFVNIGQRGFLAVDLEIREAVALLPEQFVNGEARFRHRPPLDILFCMTAPSLGLTSVSGGCVGRDDRVILVFGAPNSGKTTACYLAGRGGLEFHADQVVFLDMKSKAIQAWGDPFPAVFRPETIGYLPELLRSARYSSYKDLEFYYFDKAPFRGLVARPLTPVCGLFLNRNAAQDKELTRITTAEAFSRLHGCLLFDEDERFDAQISRALSAVSAIPMYDLRYGEDPQIAAGVIQELLA